MTCKLTMTLISEHQEGNCGDDWKYDLDVKVFHEGLKGEGRVSVPKHTLEPGAVKEPFGSPAPQVIFSGECLTELLVRMQLTATEVDLFQNDSGTVESDLTCPCPSVDDRISAHQTELSVGVRESPGFLNQVSVFTLKLRIVIERV